MLLLTEGWSCTNDCSYLLSVDQEMTGCETKPRMSPSKLEERRGQTLLSPVTT